MAPESASSSPPAAVARRLAPFGSTIFAEITRLAVAHEAINLGQGFPNFDGPDFVKEAAIEAIRGSGNQYARSFGIPALNEAIAARFARDSGVTVDPEREITVTSGCTEALAATFLGLLEPGDEVILFEPFYDSYRACVALAGAQPRFVTLRPRTSRSMKRSCGARSPIGRGRSWSTRLTIRPAGC